LQLVVPCYNEAGRLDVDAFARFVSARTDVHLLFVDDGSTDNTSQVLNDLAARSTGRISTVILPANVGKAAAVQHGIVVAFESQPELVGYWDADLATPLTAIDEFLEVLDTNRDIDIVMGARVKLLGRHVERHAIRHYFGRIYATVGFDSAGHRCLRHAVWRQDFPSQRAYPPGVREAVPVEVGVRHRAPRTVYDAQPGWRQGRGDLRVTAEDLDRRRRFKSEGVALCAGSLGHRPHLATIRMVTDLMGRDVRLPGGHHEPAVSQASPPTCQTPTVATRAGHLRRG
jgi:glycosyltransferase involved in cell wall biosynthesis